MPCDLPFFFSMLINEIGLQLFPLLSSFNTRSSYNINLQIFPTLIFLLLSSPRLLIFLVLLLCVITHNQMCPVYLLWGINLLKFSVTCINVSFILSLIQAALFSYHSTILSHLPYTSKRPCSHKVDGKHQFKKCYLKCIFAYSLSLFSFLILQNLFADPCWLYSFYS